MMPFRPVVILPWWLLIPVWIIWSVLYLAYGLVYLTVWLIRKLVLALRERHEREGSSVRPERYGAEEEGW